MTTPSFRLSVPERISSGFRVFKTSLTRKSMKICEGASIPGGSYLSITNLSILLYFFTEKILHTDKFNLERSEELLLKLPNCSFSRFQHTLARFPTTPGGKSLFHSQWNLHFGTRGTRGFQSGEANSRRLPVAIFGFRNERSWWEKERGETLPKTRKKVAARRMGRCPWDFSARRIVTEYSTAIGNANFRGNARRYVGETEVRALRPQVNSTEKDNPRTWATYSVCEIMAERSRYGQPIRCVAIHPAYDNPTMSSSTEVRFDVRCEYDFYSFYKIYFHRNDTRR